MALDIDTPGIFRVAVIEKIDEILAKRRTDTKAFEERKQAFIEEGKKYKNFRMK